jgi:virulence factor Mce-like protein
VISEPMARLTAVAVAVLMVATFAVVYLTSNPGLQGTSVEAEFEDAFPLLEGMNVRIDGAIAGTVRTIEVNDRGNAEVVLQLNEGTRPPRADASAAIRQQDITGDSYIALEPGSDPEPLGERMIPTERTIVAPRFDDLLNSVGPTEREALRLILVQTAVALDGRGEDLNEAALTLRPALEEANRALAEVGSQNTALRALIADSQRVSGQVASRDEQLARSIDGLATTVEATASEPAALDAGLEKLPATAEQARTTLAALEDLAVEARPMALELRAGAPLLVQSLDRLGPFLDDSSETLDGLIPTLVLSRKLLDAARPSIEVASDRIVTAPFSLAGGVGDLLQSLMGSEAVLRFLFGADDYGEGPGRRDDIGLGAIAVERGDQFGYPPSTDPQRNFVRAVGVMTCETFGLKIAPGCLLDALTAARRADRGPDGERSGGGRSPQPGGGDGPDPPAPGPGSPGQPGKPGPGGGNGPLGDLPKLPELPELPGLPAAPGSPQVPDTPPLNDLLGYLVGQ